MIVDSFLPNTIWKGGLLVIQAENMRMIRNPDQRVWVLRTFFKLFIFSKDSFFLIFFPSLKLPQQVLFSAQRAL